MSAEVAQEQHGGTNVSERNTGLIVEHLVLNDEHFQFESDS